MSDVAQFPTAEARRHTARQRLARYLRELADVIERDDAATEPTAALIVLSGAKRHEVVCSGYKHDASGFCEAGHVALNCTRPWRSLGRNIRPRHAYAPAKMQDENVVDGAFPHKHQDSNNA